MSKYDETYLEYAIWRGIALENFCPECQGSGYRVYADTSTWHHGIGGLTITSGVCDQCWGSGDRTNPWPSWRKLQQDHLRLQELEAQVQAAPPVVLDCGNISVLSLKIRHPILGDVWMEREGGWRGAGSVDWYARKEAEYLGTDGRWYPPNSGDITLWADGQALLRFLVQ